MAYLEWRKFNFFALVPNIDNKILQNHLRNVELTAFTSGSGQLVIGDGEGNVHLISKNYKITTFKAYSLHLSLAQQLRHTPYLVTVGDDEPGVNPFLKVWNLEKLDKSGFPTCVSILTKLVPNQRAVPATALAIHDSLNMLAVGFQDGSLMLFRGDITRYRNSKGKLLKDKDSGDSCITNISFKTVSKASYLFVSTKDDVFMYNVTVKDKEQKRPLDRIGCNPGCSATADSLQDSYFVIGSNNAVYCYTVDGKGPCYAVEGEKSLLRWFKTYLIIVTKDDTTSSSKEVGNGEVNTLTILDVENKFITFTTKMSKILCVLFEWGSFYVITKDNEIHHLNEKDVQSKLSLLFKKNSYDVAIRIAKSQHYGEEGLVDIFRQYGDHLYAKGDRQGAVEQYIKTIGKLEPSYVIRKFMDSTHMEQLMKYLQALHKVGLATGDHTMLLLNCYNKLNKTTDMKQFLMTDDRELDFDIEVALQVVRGVSPDDALQLARTHGKHVWVLRILLEDKKGYGEALEYIGHLEFTQAEECILEFGDELINKAPEETTVLLKALCTEYRQTGSGKIVTTHTSRAQPENFLHLFLNKSEYLVKFLEYLIDYDSNCSVQIYNALVEHYLVVWSKATTDRYTIEQSLIKVLKNPSATYDHDQTLILCQLYSFSPGILFLYEEKKMYHQIIQFYMKTGNYDSVLTTCKRFSHQDPFLWVQALWSVARDSSSPPHLLSSILDVIEQKKLLPPIMVVEALGEASANLGQARKYLTAVLKAEEDLLAKEQLLIDKYSKETTRIREHVSDIQGNVMIFQGSRCSVCNNQLELPSVHFLCQHSYHQHCFQSFAEKENECLACQPNNKKMTDMIKAQEQGHELHETFHSQLEKADDKFSLVAEYFGRGVFDTPPIISTDDNLQSLKQVTKPELSPVSPKERIDVMKSFEETKKLLSQPILKKSVVVEPQSLEDNLTRVTKTPTREISAISSSTTISKPYNNPFEDEYDESKNPFADDNDEQESKNPFTDSDYDESFNPFS